MSWCAIYRITRLLQNCIAFYLEFGGLSVKALFEISALTSSVFFPFHFIWNPCIPTKVGFFCMGSNMGEALALDHLKKGAEHWPTDVFILVHEEITDCLLVHCSVVRILWDLVLV